MSLSLSLTDLTSPLTQASLLKLGAPVITTLSYTQPLNTPHSLSALLIPLSSCPQFGSQSSTSSMNIAEMVWCRSALWIYLITVCDWRWGRVNDTWCTLWLMNIGGWCPLTGCVDIKNFISKNAHSLVKMDSKLYFYSRKTWPWPDSGTTKFLRKNKQKKIYHTKS